MLSYFSSYLWDSKLSQGIPVAPPLAMGRNLPESLATQLKLARSQLNSPTSTPPRKIAITPLMIAHGKLKHVVTRPPQTHFPCTNPLLVELRLRALQIQHSV